MDLYCLRLSVVLREAVETKVNVDSKRTNERGPVLAAQGRPSTKYLVPHHTLFHSFAPCAQQAGQAVVLGRLTLSMCLWSFSKPAPRGNKEMSLTWADQ
jgi:hypothetical protein